MEDDVGKKNSNTPTLAFPFALILNKTDSFKKKQICALEDLEQRRHTKYGFQEVSKALDDLFLAIVDFYDMQKATRIEWNLGDQVIRQK